MSQRRSALPEAKQHIVLQRERKGETARRVLGDHIKRDIAEKPSPQTKDLFADQNSQQARTMRAEIERVARRPFNILITGETELARLMRHEKSTGYRREPTIRSWNSTARICRNT